MGKNLTHLVITLSCSILLSSCATSNYDVSEDLAELKITFVDSKWDGETVPKDEICKRWGANGSSPEIKVDNIPSGTNAIIVEFNDRSYQPLSTGGGHGAIWVTVENSTSVIVPSVMTETNELPTGVNIEHKHRGRGHGSGIGGGVYLAPCSSQLRNLYSADIKAVNKSESNSIKLLGTGMISLGRY